MQKEYENKVRGVLGSVLFHIFLLLLLSLPFMSLPYQDPPLKQSGGEMLINFSDQKNTNEQKEEKAINPVQNPSKQETEQEKELINSQEITETVNVKFEDSVIKENTDLQEERLKELTEKEQNFDKNNNGVLDANELESMADFDETMKNMTFNENGESNLDEEGYQGDGTSLGNGKFGDSLEVMGDHRIGPKTIECGQKKGIGFTVKVLTIIDAAGDIVDIDEESLVSLSSEISWSTPTQRKNLLDCIKSKYKLPAAKGEDKSDKLFLIELEFGL